MKKINRPLIEMGTYDVTLILSILCPALPYPPPFTEPPPSVHTTALAPPLNPTPLAPPNPLPPSTQPPLTSKLPTSLKLQPYSIHPKVQPLPIKV